MNEAQALDRVVVTEQMRKTLELSFDVWDLLIAKQEIEAAKLGIKPGESSEVAFAITEDELTTILRKRFNAPIDRRRIIFAMQSLGEQLAANGMNSCALWRFAHQLDHALYDELATLPV